MKRNRRSGQAIVLLLALLVAIVAMIMWTLDIHTILMRKLRLQDCGDASALTAARWQAAGLNLIGEINLMRAFMLIDGAKVEEVEALYELQQRILLTTPFLALLSAQEVAALNNARPWPEESVAVMKDYFRELSDWSKFQNYHEGAREEYQDLTRILFSDAREIYAMPQLPIYEEADPQALLVTQDFYEAILARNWCWFKFAGLESFLRTYRSPQQLGPLPNFRSEPAFGLYLTGFQATLREFREGECLAGEGALNTRDTMHLQALNYAHPGLELADPDFDLTAGESPEEKTITWMGFDERRWNDWKLLRELPMRSDIKPQYDYRGIGAVMCVWEDDTTRWLAAAKPFGSIGDENPIRFPLVLGGFNDVRLVPVDAVESGITMPDPAWMRHLHSHIAGFYAHGSLPYADTCRYCRALEKWQLRTFRLAGFEWLREYGHTCRQPRPGGPSPTGGATYAH